MSIANELFSILVSRAGQVLIAPVPGHCSPFIFLMKLLDILFQMSERKYRFNRWWENKSKKYANIRN